MSARSRLAGVTWAFFSGVFFLGPSEVLSMLFCTSGRTTFSSLKTTPLLRATVHQFARASGHLADPLLLGSTRQSMFKSGAIPSSTFSVLDDCAQENQRFAVIMPVYTFQVKQPVPVLEDPRTAVWLQMHAEHESGILPFQNRIMSLRCVI